MLRAGTLRVAARLGRLSLEDVQVAREAKEPAKMLLSIEGEELADFRYETFDPADQETFPGYNSSVVLKAGSLKLTFLEHAIRQLYIFGMKFARMKAFYDAAREAAVQRVAEVTRMHYDINVKTPIILLPSSAESDADRLILRLGAIIAKNQYLGDANDTSTIEASLSGISVSSEITVEQKLAKLQMVQDITISGDVKQRSQHGGEQRAETEVRSVRWAGLLTSTGRHQDVRRQTISHSKAVWLGHAHSRVLAKDSGHHRLR